jgi:hypothetical protein
LKILFDNLRRGCYTMGVIRMTLDRNSTRNTASRADERNEAQLG